MTFPGELFHHDAIVHAPPCGKLDPIRLCRLECEFIWMMTVRVFSNTMALVHFGIALSPQLSGINLFSRDHTCGINPGRIPLYAVSLAHKWPVPFGPIG